MAHCKLHRLHELTIAEGADQEVRCTVGMELIKCDPIVPRDEHQQSSSIGFYRIGELPRRLEAFHERSAGVDHRNRGPGGNESAFRVEHAPGSNRLPAGGFGNACQLVPMTEGKHEQGGGPAAIRSLHSIIRHVLPLPTPLLRAFLTANAHSDAGPPWDKRCLPPGFFRPSKARMTANADRPTALLASPTEAAQAAEALLRQRYQFVALEEAQQIVALGGDGFLLQTLHEMLHRETVWPVFGMNRGTIGFLMNEWRLEGLRERLNNARRFSVAPLRMEAVTVRGERLTNPAINEVSLLRETRQTAWIEVSINGRTVLPELVCDGVLVATPAGSTAYNLSAQGPILPLGSNLVALTPISPFRPRRWRGALVPDDLKIVFRVLDPVKRPVSAVADQLEVRDVATVEIRVDRSQALSLLFDPEHALDERITMEQFAV